MNFSLIAYTGKDCGMSMPIKHVEECWQMAEFYNNKILVEYKSKRPKSLWSATAKAKAAASSAPAPPPPPPASLFSSESSSPSSSKPKEGMAAVFQEISSGKPVTEGLRKAGPPKLELQMGRKWVVENQIGRKNLVIDDCDAKTVCVYFFGCRKIQFLQVHDGACIHGCGGCL
ncbi:hypothetical protein OIU76_029985 [Salix suchowensis]|nr:hypothetical protein OIU76_029985 [Salix suchowensis]